MKIKMILMMILILALIPQIGSAKWRTPYRSIDVNNFNDVARALEKPEWLVNYAKWEFSYTTDGNQQKTARQMFIDKKGNCKGYAIFYKKVLQTHGYSSESTYPQLLDKACTVFA